MRPVVFFVFFLAVLGAAVAIGTLEPGSSEARESVTSEPDGRIIWLRDCAVCHGADGHGGSDAPDIGRAGPALVDFMVTTGRMPLPEPGAEVVRRTSPYTAAEQRALVGYVSTLTDGEPIPEVRTEGVDIGAGGQAYRLQCATCHQSAGSGGALAFGVSAPPLDRATPTQVVEAMRTGPGTMPVFTAATIDAEEAADIAAYVQTLQDPQDPGGANLGHLGPVPEGLVAWLVGIGAILVLTRLLGRRRAR